MRILTGIKPTADQYHLGNYFGAVKPFFDLIKTHIHADAYLMTANMHALTTLHDAQIMRKNTISCVKLYMAMLIADPELELEDVCVYNPADIPGHAQLQRVLQCLTHVGFLERMHAYKDAAAKGKKNMLSSGTFSYPALQAADILLYDATHVPVGKDQKQHIEYARDIAEKVNHIYGEVFTLPEPIIMDQVATVPGIDGRKMSKSYNNFIGLLDEEKLIRKKIARIPTSATPVADPKDPDTCNVFAIYSLFIDEDEQQHLRKRYTNGGLAYGELKKELADIVVQRVKPIQTTYASLDDDQVRSYLNTNLDKIKEGARQKIDNIYTHIGFSLDKQ